MKKERSDRYYNLFAGIITLRFTSPRVQHMREHIVLERPRSHFLFYERRVEKEKERERERDQRTLAVFLTRTLPAAECTREA